MLLLFACGGESQNQNNQTNQDSQSAQSEQSTEQQTPAPEEVDPLVGTWKAYMLEGDGERFLIEDYPDEPEFQEMASFTVIIKKDDTFDLSFMDSGELFEDTGTLNRQGSKITGTTTHAELEFTYSDADDLLTVGTPNGGMILKRS